MEYSATLHTHTHIETAHTHNDLVGTLRSFFSVFLFISAFLVHILYVISV